MNGGGPAFPGNASSEHFWGMSLRDYFAAAVIGHIYPLMSPGTDADRAKRAYQIADAMLAERNKAAT